MLDYTCLFPKYTTPFAHLFPNSLNFIPVPIRTAHPAFFCKKQKSDNKEIPPPPTSVCPFQILRSCVTFLSCSHSVHTALNKPAFEQILRTFFFSLSSLILPLCTCQGKRWLCDGGKNNSQPCTYVSRVSCSWMIL